MKNPTPVLLDRLAHALERQGVKLKRAQLLETAACAFGFHNSNEFTAAAKRGDLAATPAVPIGRIRLPNGETLIVLTDADASSAYGICEAFVDQVVDEERRESIGVTPYGHLIDLSGVSATSIPTIEAGSSVDGESSESKVATPSDLMRNIIFAENAFIRQAMKDDPHNGVPPSGGRTLEWLVRADERYAEGLSSGLDDGTYDDRAGLDEVRSAIEVGRIAIETSARDADGGEETAARPIDSAFIPVHFATITHKHGSNEYLSFDRAGLDRQIAAYCREEWHEITDEDDVPEDPTGMPDEEVSAMYFEIMEEQEKEWLSTSVIDVEKIEGLTMPEVAPVDRTGRETEARASRVRSASSIDSEDELVWITDSDGNDTFQVGESLLKRHGLSYHVLTEHEFELICGGETLNGSIHPVRLGMSVLWKGRKWLAPEVQFDFGDPEGQGDDEETALTNARSYMEFIRTDVEKLGGSIHLFPGATDFAHEMTILLPFSLPEEAHSIDDWKKALAYLLLPDWAKPKRFSAEAVTADFNPQVSISGNVYSIEPLGDTSWDATFDALMKGDDAAGSIVHGMTDADEYRDSPLAPEWVREWDGPFEIEFDGSLQRFFTIAGPN